MEQEKRPKLEHALAGQEVEMHKKRHACARPISSSHSLEHAAEKRDSLHSQTRVSMLLCCR